MRQSCSDCGAWTENPALAQWFTERHNHPPGIPIVFKTAADPETFAVVFAKFGYVCHQVAPASPSSLAVFVSSNAQDPLEKVPRIIVSDANELDALLSGGRRL